MELAFEGKTFKELFPKCGKWADEGKRIGISMSTGEMGNQGHLITSYMIVSGPVHRSLRVRPSKALVAWIRERMILVDRDLMYFGACVRDDGTALLTVSYSQILGSRWLALVPASTVPKPKKVVDVWAEPKNRKCVVCGYGRAPFVQEVGLYVHEGECAEKLQERMAGELRERTTEK